MTLRRIAVKYCDTGESPVGGVVIQTQAESLESGFTCRHSLGMPPRGSCGMIVDVKSRFRKDAQKTSARLVL